MSDEFEKYGGREVLEKVTKAFYDKVYDHPWLNLFFKDIPREKIEVQQIDFVQGALGGPRVFCGALPIQAHKRMFITEELFDIREGLLKEALEEVGANPALIEKWITIDESFRSGICKKDLSECEKRFMTEDLLVFEDPQKSKIKI